MTKSDDAQKYLNVGKIESMLDEIEHMTDLEHDHIHGILSNAKVNFTENDNGLFVRINQLSMETIKQLFEYVEKYRETQKDSENVIRNLIKNKKTLKTTEQQEENFGLFNDIKLDTEKWKTDVIDSLRKKKRK